MRLYKRSNGVYYVSFSDPTRSPQKKRISLETREKDVAQEKARYLEMEHFKGNWDPWREEKPKDRDLWDACFEALGIRYDDSPKHYYQSMKSLYSLFAKSVGRDKPLQNVSASDIRRFLQEYENQNTKHSYYTYLASLFHWFKERGWIRYNPIDKVKTPRKVRSERPTFTEKQFHHVQNQCRYPHLQFATYLMYHSGLRPGEARMLPWDHVDLNNRFIHIKKVSYGNTVWTPKGDKSRKVPISIPLKEAFEDWRQQYMNHVWDGPDERYPKFVYLSKRAKPISKSGAQKQWRTTRRECGLPKKLTLHCFRHTFASRMIRKGMNISTLQKILGHTSVTTTEMYVHLFAEDTKNELDSLLGYGNNT
jgi:integrase